MGEVIRAGEADLYVEEVGQGPAVLLVAGLGDPAEAWQAQLETLGDRYRLIAFDNRGSGRSPRVDGRLSTASMADDAAALLRALGVSAAHVAGFSMGSAIAHELALRHPDAVRSLVLVSTYARPDALFRAQLAFWRWLPEVAPSKRAFLEAFCTWVYTRRAHDDGSVERIIEAGLAFPHWWSIADFQAQVDACLGHDTVDRLPGITAPTLIMAGDLDVVLPPRFGLAVAQAIPGAQFEVLPGEAHLPFQEAPDTCNARVDAYWREVEAAA
jgi:pimeloyl-ACP methyl ester carboxylesterase